MLDLMGNHVVCKGEHSYKEVGVDRLAFVCSDDGSF